MSYETPKTVDELFIKNQSTDVVKRLNAGENFSSFAAEKVEVEPFEPEEIRCCDGRPVFKEDQITAAGSGILMPEEIFDAFIKAHPSIKRITTHAGCGANQVAFDQAKADGTLPEGIEDAAAYGEWWAKKMAAKYNLEYRHIDTDEFVAPEHHEQGIVMDATGALSITMMKDMPNMFFSHSASADKEGTYSAGEPAVLSSIGFGKHGLGDRLTAGKPFYILIAAKDQTQADALTAKVREKVSGYGDRIKVESFVVPLVQVSA